MDFWLARAKHVAHLTIIIIFLPFILQSVSLVCYVLSTCVHICYYITTFVYTRDPDVANCAHAGALYMNNIHYEHFVN